MELVPGNKPTMKLVDAVDPNDSIDGGMTLRLSMIHNILYSIHSYHSITIIIHLEVFSDYSVIYIPIPYLYSIILTSLS